MLPFTESKKVPGASRADVLFDPEVAAAVAHFLRSRVVEDWTFMQTLNPVVMRWILALFMFLIIIFAGWTLEVFFSRLITNSSLKPEDLDMYWRIAKTIYPVLMIVSFGDSLEWFEYSLGCFGMPYQNLKCK